MSDNTETCTYIDSSHHMRNIGKVTSFITQKYWTPFPRISDFLYSTNTARFTLKRVMLYEYHFVFLFIGIIKENVDRV